MTQFLPPNLLALFAARDPIPYLAPVERLSHEKRTTGYSGIGEYVKYFENGPAPERPKYETKEERKERRRREKQEQIAYRLEQQIALWDPSTNDKGTTDPFKTLFIARINYDTTESKLKREFEAYGPIKKIIMCKDKKTSKPRGYAFVEYEHERDMHSAYKHADGKKIDGKRVLVDVERGRTVKGWLPRRLGGGLGGTRRGGPEVNIKISGREDPDRDRFRDERRDRRDRSKERNVSSERDRSDRRRDRRRSSDRVSRSDRGDRDRERDRDKDRSSRKRHRSRSRDRDRIPEDEEERPRKRSRSREKKRHRDRSRSKDKKKDKKDRDRDRGDRKERDRDRKIKSEKLPKREEDDGFNQVRIKQEPIDDDYPSFDGYDYNNHHQNYIKQEM